MTLHRARRRLPAVLVALLLVSAAVPADAAGRPPSRGRGLETAQARADTQRSVGKHRNVRQARAARPAPNQRRGGSAGRGLPRRGLPRPGRDRDQPTTQTTDVAATLVQTIDLSLMSPPSSDSSDVAYDPNTDRLIVVDGEIDEPNMAWLYQGVNMFNITRQGVYMSGGSTTLPNPHDFSKEPVGAGFIPETGTLLIADDNQDDLSFVRAGSDGIFGNSNDTVTELIHVLRVVMGSNADPEGVAYDTSTGEIWITDGLNAEVWRWNPGANGRFDDVVAGASDTSGIDDVFTHFDTEVHGLVDSEGIAYDPFSDTLLCLSVNGNVIYRFDKDGGLRERIGISGSGMVSPSGLALAPSSFDPGALSLWITDRGIDNGPAGTEPTTENDGKLVEMTLGTFSNFQPVVTIASPADGGNIPANQPVIFRAGATDAEDGNVTSSIVWESTALVGSPDCSASTPTERVCALVLRPGQQTVRAKAFDSLGVFGVRQISLYVGPGPYTVTIPAGAGSDDAEERPTGGSVRLGDQHLQMTQDGSNVQTIGVRFPGVSVPAGAYLASAHVQFTTYASSSGPSSLTIEAHAADNAPTFTSASGSVSSRPRTSASVSWTPEDWPLVGEAGPKQRTPDLVPLLTAVFGRPGWVSGNALAFIVTGSGTRTARAIEGGVVGAPKLTITFQFTPPVRITAPLDGASLPIARATTFSGTAGPLTSTIDWSSSVDGPLGTGGTISARLSGNADGSPRAHVITAAVIDGDGNAGTASITVQTQNLAPVVRIDRPGNDSSHPAGDRIAFMGTATDPDDGDLAYRLIWTSNIDGRLGRGAEARRTLTPGTHVITLEASDRFGLKGLAQITIQVGMAAPSADGVGAAPPGPLPKEQPAPPDAGAAAAEPSSDPPGESPSQRGARVGLLNLEDSELSTKLGMTTTERALSVTP